MHDAPYAIVGERKLENGGSENIIVYLHPQRNHVACSWCATRFDYMSREHVNDITLRCFHCGERCIVREAKEEKPVTATTVTLN